MNDQHIIDRLDAGPLAHLSAREVETIEQHTANCESCRREYSAAQVVDDLVHVRATATVEPSPFFQTRVMAAWRERGTADVWGFARIWRSAAALVSSMAVTVAVLVALTFAMPGTTFSDQPDPATVQASAYSAEDVIFDGGNDSAVTDGQAATAILNDDDEGR